MDVAEAAVREVLASLLGDPRHLHGYLQAAQRAAVPRRRGRDGGPRLVATAQARAPLSAEGGDERLYSLEGAARRNRLNPPGGVGGGGSIEAKPVRRFTGIPRYLQSHHRMDMTAFVDAIRAQGLLAMPAAARGLGTGETTLRRAEERGLVRLEWRS